MAPVGAMPGLLDEGGQDHLAGPAADDRRQRVIGGDGRAGAEVDVQADSLSPGAVEVVDGLGEAFAAPGPGFGRPEAVDVDLHHCEGGAGLSREQPEALLR
ncbi:hypothetical protein J2X45_000747 [Caulobacter sp. BE264]|nr:hypothetical protein [Caulobacter sp. BE264]